ncbi:MAG: ethanolamine utilization protein [Burkholderiales bacterium]|nr:ethanolamine utilization protein [Burkholderiales bacterium]
MSLLEQPFVFVDLETTGANAERDRITEVGIVEWDGNEAREWSMLVNPGTPIPPFITKLTGISDDMVRDAPSFAELAPALFERLRGRVFAAHNARFDYGFLKHEFKRAGIDFRARTVCTVKLSKRLFPGEYKHNLDSVAARNGLLADGDRHRALTDARLIYQFLVKMRAEHDAETLEKVLDEISRPPSLPPGVDPELIEAMPDSTGVYQLIGEGGEVLFVGRTDNIKKKVLAHFGNNLRAARDKLLAVQTRHIEWIATAGELGAHLAEIRLLRELQPLHNPHHKHSDDWYSWAYQPNEDGTAQPALVPAGEADFGQVALYGLYSSQKEATTVLRKIAEANRLCLVALGLDRGSRRPGTPCFGMQVGRCRGACVGKEPLLTHQARVCAVLSKFRLRAWPYKGRVVIREQNDSSSAADLHVFENWRYIGTAGDEVGLATLLETRSEPVFDADIFKLLTKYLGAATNLQVHPV